MEITLSLRLPRDGLSVAVLRRVLHRCMETLGIDAEVSHDVQTAVSEAATNVLDHSCDGDDYEVACAIGPESCVITVTDRGEGFDSAVTGLADAEPGAERGRGVQLMRALVDGVQFERCPDNGMVVRLEKRLRWTEAAPAARLLRTSDAAG